jgi:hypothetical protein
MWQELDGEVYETVEVGVDLLMEGIQIDLRWVRQLELALDPGVEEHAVEIRVLAHDAGAGCQRIHERVSFYASC